MAPNQSPGNNPRREPNKKVNAVQSLEQRVTAMVTNDSPSDLNPWPEIPSDISLSSSGLSGRLLAVAVHLTLFIMFAGTFLYNIYWDICRGSIIITDWIYLTHWNLTFQVIFCTIELMADYDAAFAERTAPVRSKMFHTIVTPFCLLVSSFFWLLCSIDENLVRAADPNERCEEWYNQVVHTMIVPAVFLQSYASYHKPSPLIESYTISVVCAFIYTCWSCMWGILFDLWSYELMRILTGHQFLLVLICLMTYLCILQTIGRKVHMKIWQPRLVMRP